MAPSPKTILITGATGTVGRRLVPILQSKGFEITILALPDDPGAVHFENQGVRVIRGNITQPETLAGGFEGTDIIVHLAALILSPLNPQALQEVNFQGTENLVRLSERFNVSHFVYISSASVTYPEHNPYSKSKKAAEGAVMNIRKGHFTIIRPTLVYDDEGGLEFMHFVRHLKRLPVVPFIGSGRALKSPVHTDDFIDALAKVPDNPAAFGKVYNFSGGEVLSLREMAILIMDRLGMKKTIIPLPVSLCRGAALFNGFLSRISGSPPLLTWQTITGFIFDAALDNQAARDELGFNPRPFSEGLKNLKQLPGSGP